MVDKRFDKVDFTIKPPEREEYESCTFKNCDFSNSDLSEMVFMECEFENCNLSLVKLNKTALRDIKFINCKMLGLRFENCNQFGGFLFEDYYCGTGVPDEKEIDENLKGYHFVDNIDLISDLIF